MIFIIFYSVIILCDCVTQYQTKSIVFKRINKTYIIIYYLNQINLKLFLCIGTRYCFLNFLRPTKLHNKEELFSVVKVWYLLPTRFYSFFCFSSDVLTWHEHSIDKNINGTKVPIICLDHNTILIINNYSYSKIEGTKYCKYFSKRLLFHGRDINFKTVLSAIVYQWNKKTTKKN